MPTPYAYFEGQFMPTSEAKVNIMTHALHYGTAVFEGIRGNWNEDEGVSYLFRVREHYQRLRRSCRILKMDHLPDEDSLCEITSKLVSLAGFKEDVYIRPLAYKSTPVLGVRLHDLNDDFLAFVTPFGPYLDIEKGIRVCTSSWRRVEDTGIPARAKVTGIYVNSALVKTEAFDNGYDEGIMLNEDGHVCEGSGENVFMVEDGRLVTPPSSSNILVGITRETIMTLAREEMGIETVEREIDRSELYTCDEFFLTGTAAHVSPVIEIDHRIVGEGGIGPITKRLMTLYFDVVKGKNAKYAEWCTPVVID
jgi:branched-chain amino acid aminotransferase